MESKTKHIDITGKRLSTANNNEKQPLFPKRRKRTVPSEPTVEHASESEVQTITVLQATHPEEQDTISSRSHSLSGAKQKSTAAQPSISPASSIGSDHLIRLPALTVYAALFLNSRILGIACSLALPSRSSPPTPDIPQSLHPTSLQLTTMHHRFIDNFPFPRLRDSMISLGGLIDEEEFLGDLFMMQSFTLTPNANSWDSEAWKIGDEFKDKWGYLLL